MKTGADFGPDVVYPDGSRPWEVLRRWEPWIRECVEFFLDPYGGFYRLRYDLPYIEYPAVDLEVYRVIRAEWARLAKEK